MPAKRENILIVEPDAESRQKLLELLRSAGYDASPAATQEDGFKTVQAGGVDLFLLSADLWDLRCCNALAEIKGLATTAATRVILLVRGGGEERARGLDLGADDVLSQQWEPAELMARVRAQLRDKRAYEQLWERTRIASEGQEIAQTAFQAVAVTEKMTRDAISLDRALKIGVGSLILVALVIAGIFLLYSRRADRETKRAYSVIARLELGVQRQEELVAETRKMRADLQETDASLQKEQLQKQTEELRQKISSGDAGDISALKKQLEEANGRLKRVVSESDAAEGVIRSYAPSVCLLHVSVAFNDKSSGRRLRYGGINPDGGPLKDSDGNIVYTLQGRAPEVRADFFGTGFLVADGKILTNHHVAQPWWKNDELSSALQQGLEPAIAEMTAYFPDAPSSVSVGISQISEEVDLSLLHADLSSLKRPILKMDGRKEAAISGQPLISLGYATGISAILARAGEGTVDDIVKVSGGDPTKITEELLRRKLIRPLVTQGHIGDVLADKIVYDAQTTSGGSGGPLINREGEVIGVTFAVVKGFGGSNFGVPIRYAQPLLKVQ
ncbi:MAG TPA: trypsin-like peptidase domain-containing protein [Candidatus Acidoferrales bacterium]|nr:trypsin-like peptidase domain-containing protein [Candidatus Acidoferrales bacterium]